jgi:hypothetical protein
VPDIDTFAALLLEEAKRFLENAVDADDIVRRDAYLHAALTLGFSGLEAHVNAVCEEFSTRPELSAHERALLLEEDVKLENGEFKPRGLKMYRLEERITFLHTRFSGKPLDKKVPWWGALGTAIDMRNKLTHPKGAQTIGVDGVKCAIRAIVDAIDALYQAIYKKKFPAASRGLQSRLTF